MAVDMKIGSVETRLSAMDPATLTEVVIQGPASAGEIFWPSSAVPWHAAQKTS